MRATKRVCAFAQLVSSSSSLSRGGIEREAAAMLGAAAADVFRPFVRQASERDGETESATEVGGSRRELESKRACDGELFEAVL